MRASLPHSVLRGRPRRRFSRAPRQRAHLSAVTDPALNRARQAGGPLDCASYSCRCGYLFTAPVSTTVACPHCGACQPW
jgi:hypothetical protein